jgi:hypothetical protein
MPYADCQRMTLLSGAYHSEGRQVKGRGPLPGTSPLFHAHVIGWLLVLVHCHPSSINPSPPTTSNCRWAEGPG